MRKHYIEEIIINFYLSPKIYMHTHTHLLFHTQKKSYGLGWGRKNYPYFIWDHVKKDKWYAWGHKSGKTECGPGQVAQFIKATSRYAKVADLISSQGTYI